MEILLDIFLVLVFVILIVKYEVRKKSLFLAVGCICIAVAGHFFLHSVIPTDRWIFLGAMIVGFAMILLTWRDAKNENFSANIEAMSYVRHDLNLSVIREQQLVIVNGTRIPLADFSYTKEKRAQEVSYNTGSNQTVRSNTGAAVGTVYVPGESGSYSEYIGWDIQIFNGSSLIYFVEFRGKSTKSLDALSEVLKKIKTWRTQVTQKDATDTAQNSFEQLCQQARVGKDCFKKLSYDKQGKLTQTLAVDRSGKALAVYNNGAETWMGSLKGATAQIVDSKLELKVDDPAYREKHLSERRISLLEGEKREVLVEWEDRINLLAKNVA